ncbi:MAG TPA: hypothetical protein VFK57_00455 [Vicinamibacterales bacterium]|nr:hypothetical protein [Vicinamibacterales bacterium]
MRTLAAGALTGMRSMAGPMALARSRGGNAARAIAVFGGAEMIADKTRFVGNRIDAAPLAGRAVIGAVVGGFVAHEYRENIAIGALLGASAAVAAAHLAYYVRRRLPVSNVVGGALEDAVVIGLMQQI